MIRNNDIIQGYTVLMVANGMILAHSKTAPDPYVVWHTAENGNDVYDGKYLPNKEDAEWDFCTKAFPWFEDNAPINIIEDNAATGTLMVQRNAWNPAEAFWTRYRRQWAMPLLWLRTWSQNTKSWSERKQLRRRKATIPKSTIFLILILKKLLKFHQLSLNIFQSSKTSQSQKRNRY